ncbi:hypothetical protein Q5P01_020868 [Channa striata]|uniref:Ig-like domain-containing protein n=1 Tax=Channa striata TaxID=64152 RepID=A0AA88LYA8_CHASR|nr:hypothetical protein Q5P01_020868 [Channa striata]
MKHNTLIIVIHLFNVKLVSGSSLSENVKQTPADIYSKPGETANITCLHRIKNYDQILWYKQTNRALKLLGHMLTESEFLEPGMKNHYDDSVTHHVCRFVSEASSFSVHSQGVSQNPERHWRYVSNSAEMNCSHNKDAGHNQMYWYRQRPGETMTLIVYAVFGGQPDYGEAPDKYSATRDSVQTGALTVRDLKPEDSGMYFCAVSNTVM